MVVAGATMRLWTPPVSKCLLVLGFTDDIAAAAAVPAILTQQPFTVESLTEELLALVGHRPSDELLPSTGGAWLLVEAGGQTMAEAEDHATRLARAIGRGVADRDVRVLTGVAAQAALWRIREDGAGYAARLPDGSPAWPGFEDAAVPPDRLAAYLTELHQLLRDQGMGGVTYGHFGEGCIHLRVGFGLDKPGGEQRFGTFMDAAADLVARHGGTLSGEHGDGRARGALLPRMFSPEMIDAFRGFKALWDPDGLLNPGIIVDPVPVTDSLRWTAPARMDIRPQLAYQHDHGDMRAAVSRCIGVGRCVSRQGSALMCPSYRATGREQDSTRGRARLLQEMVAGSLSTQGWRSTEVRDALDLCLSCKGCVSECPTGVDMASYKSEFLHHHYQGRLRPRSHYSLGALPRWLRASWRMAPLANALMRHGVTRRMFSAVAGISAERAIPPIARMPFTRGHEPLLVRTTARRGRITLWPDTFTNYLSPEVGHAAVRVAAAAGYGVDVPMEPVCCGLTWITTGQLDTAKRVLRKTLDAASLATDQPLVVLEPSCAASLKVDLPELLPDDPRAHRARRACHHLWRAHGPGGIRRARGTCRPTAPRRQPSPSLTATSRRSWARPPTRVSWRGTVSRWARPCPAAAGWPATSARNAATRRSPGRWPSCRWCPHWRPRTRALSSLPTASAAGRRSTALSGRRARHLAEVLAERLDRA